MKNNRVYLLREDKSIAMTNVSAGIIKTHTFKECLRLMSLGFAKASPESFKTIVD